MTKILYIIIAVSFLDTFIQLPIITPYAQELGASYMLTGAIIAVYSFSNMIGNVIAGHWIDRFGRKKLLLTGMLCVAAVLLLYPLAQTGWQLFSARFFHGLAGGALLPAAFAYIGDMSAENNRGRTMAYTGACIGSTAIAGPAIGGAVAAQLSIEYVFILVTVLFVLTSALIVFFVQESFKGPERGQVALQDFIPLLKHPLLIQACLTAFALMVSNGTLAFALPLYVEEMGMDTAVTGMLLSTFGIVALIVFLTPLNKLFDSVDPVPLILSGISAIGVSLVMLSAFGSLPAAIAAMIVYGGGFALIFPSMNRIISDITTAVDRGKAYGVFYASFSLGVVSGSFIAGIVAELLGFPFLVSAAIMLSVGVVIFFIARRYQELLRKDMIRS